jgi:hypothetical protein
MEGLGLAIYLTRFVDIGYPRSALPDAPVRPDRAARRKRRRLKRR